MEKDLFKKSIREAIEERRNSKEISKAILKDELNVIIADVLKSAMDKVVTELKIPRDEVVSALANFKNTEIGNIILEGLKPTLKELSGNSSITKKEILEAFKEIVINVPETKVPEAKVNVSIPEIKIPKIEVPEIKVPQIKIPKIEVPKIEIPKIPPIKMPESMKVNGSVSLEGIGINNPLSVQLRDSKGNPVNIGGGSVMSGGRSGAINQASILKVTNSDGSVSEVPNIDKKLRVSSESYLYDISEGNIPGYTPWIKNGYNGGLSAVEQSLWAVGGDYVFPTAEMQMEVVSSSANDTAAGSGARTVYISYLDSNFVEKTETVTLNGLTAVPTTATDIYRVNNFRVATVGATGYNEGNIDVRHLTDTPVYSRIATSTNRAINCIYTIPKDKCLYIYNILFSAASNVANRPVRFITKAKYDNISFSAVDFFMPYTNVVINDGSVDVPIELPTKFCEGIDIKVNAISPDGATYGAVTLRGWLEPE